MASPSPVAHRKQHRCRTCGQLMKGHPKNGCSPGDQLEQLDEVEILHNQNFKANDVAKRGSTTPRAQSNGPTIPFVTDAGPSCTPDRTDKAHDLSIERTVSPPARWEQWKSMWPVRLDDQRPVMPGAFANDRPSLISVPPPLKERIGPKVEDIDETYASSHSIRATPSEDGWNLISPPSRERYVSAPLQEMPTMIIQRGTGEEQNSLIDTRQGTPIPNRPRYASESLPRPPKNLLDRLSGPPVGSAYDHNSEGDQETFSDSDTEPETEVDANSDTHGSVIFQNLSNIAGTFSFRKTQRRYKPPFGRHPLSRSIDDPSSGSMISELLTPGSQHDVPRSSVQTIAATAESRGLRVVCFVSGTHTVLPGYVRLRIERAEVEDRHLPMRRMEDRVVPVIGMDDRHVPLRGMRRRGEYRYDPHQYQPSYRDDYVHVQARSPSRSVRPHTPNHPSSSPTPVPAAPPTANNVSLWLVFSIFLVAFISCILLLCALSSIPA